METLPSDDSIISIIRNKIMRNDPMTLEKSLWRLARGKRELAYDIIRKTAPHYGLQNIKDFHIDCALAELNNGVEVEWED